MDEDTPQPQPRWMTPPSPEDWVIESAMLLGAQLEEIERTLAHYRIAWGNYTPDPNEGDHPGMRNLEYLDSKGYNMLSDRREQLRKQLFDLFDKETTL